ncbi:MAG: hypothetical protein IJZ39_06490 [Oscillospiraceae bacterium]|nr:hypothetical protein [Oscillospiraceae bacterium]
MGYRIVYGKDAFAETGERKSHLRAMTAGFALALVVLVRIFWPEGTAVLRDVLLPGQSTAFSQLTEDLRAGEPIGDAVTAFCRSIVEEAVAKPD